MTTLKRRLLDWSATIVLIVLPILVLRASLNRGRPFGTDKWITRTADKLGLQHTIRREGRPTGKLPQRESRSDKMH